MASYPAPGSEQRRQRELYAALVVQGRHIVEPRFVRWLIRAYAALEGISGYWVMAVNCGQTGVQLRGYAELALGLEATSEKPVMCSGVGHCHLSLLASG